MRKKKIRDKIKHPFNNGGWSNSEVLIQLHGEEKSLSTLRRLLRKRARMEMEKLIGNPIWENLIEILCWMYRFWHGLSVSDQRYLESGQRLTNTEYKLQNVGLDSLRQRFDIITPQNIEPFFDEWLAIIQADRDKIKLRELLQYSKAALIAARKNAQEIVVNGLFALQEQGCVKDVILEISKEEQTQGEPPFEIHFRMKTGCEQEVQQSIENAKKAAFRCLNVLAIGNEEYSAGDMLYRSDAYGVSIYLEDYPGSIQEKWDEIRDAGGVEGKSLGLTIALGILHRFLGHHPQTENFAATGEIDEIGKVSSLDSQGIKKKVYAACARKIPKVIVPVLNESHALEAKSEALRAGLIKEEDDIQIIGVKTLLEAACAVFELNVTFFHCNHALIREQPSFEIRDLQELEGCCGPRIILHPYFDEKLNEIESNQFAKKIAAQCAKRWLDANPEERNRIPSPVILNAGQNYSSPVQAIASALKPACQRSLSTPSTSSEIVQSYLDDRRFSVLIEGFNANLMTERLRDLLDGNFKPPLFTPGGILQKLLENQREQNVILVCCESMASWIKKENQVLASYFSGVSRCYEGRSTAFDKHVDAVTKDYGRIIACLHPPNIPPYKDELKTDDSSGRKYLPPDVFFYDRESTQKLFIDIDIQAKWQTLRLYELLEEEEERTSQHFLILGGGNAGKSTLLLKIFHDCKREQNPLPYVPVLVPFILALLSDIKLDEILQNVPNRVADFLKCRWEAAEIIVKSDLSEKFYPLQRFLRDFKNYFFTEWADKQASVLEEMARHNEPPQQILKDSIKKMLSIDRTRVEEKLGDIDSLDEEAIKKKIKSCFGEGQWQETTEKGFTWSTILMLGVPFKQVTSLNELTEMLNNAQADIDRNQASGPPETYPRDILKKLKNEKEEEERQRE